MLDGGLPFNFDDTGVSDTEVKLALLRLLLYFPLIWMKLCPSILQKRKSDTWQAYQLKELIN
jgi:hypothetical protein